MKPLFFIVVTLFLIVVQTVVLPSFPFFYQSFDLLIIDIFFLSLIATHYSMLFAVIGIGAVMDSISGVPFFFYIFSYMSLYFIVQLFKQLLFKRSTVFIIIVSLISVIIQQLLLLFSIFVRQGIEAVAGFDYILLFWQILWGVLFIPAGIWFLNLSWKSWNQTAAFLQKQIIKRIEE